MKIPLALAFKYDRQRKQYLKKAEKRRQVWHDVLAGLISASIMLALLLSV